MALNVSAWSIRRPFPAILLSLIVGALGMISLRLLPVGRLPSIDVPTISVTVAEFGAAPAELDAQVTQAIETAVAGVADVRHITSSITDGMSVTTVQFQIGRNADLALNDIKDAVTRVRSTLPHDISEPLIQHVDVVPLPIVTYAAVASGKTPAQLSWFVDDVVRRALQGVPGVGQVERIGGVDREIAVALDPDRLNALGLTAADVSRHLRSTRVDVAGGRAEIGGGDQMIRTLAAATTLDGLSGTMLPLPTGSYVRLDDLGTITDTIAEPRSFARLDGKPIVGFSVNRSKTASDVATASAVAKTIDDIKAAYPDVDLQLFDDTTTKTYDDYKSAVRNLLEGAVPAVILLFLFLRDWRATLIAAIALPLSILPAFWVMDILGLSLNLVSVLAIAVSAGILVDDAIVEIETIERHRRMGKPPRVAAIDAAAEIGQAGIATGLTMLLVFVPLSFIGGDAGQIFKPFGITISVQVFASLLVARVVTPVLAAYLLRSTQGVEHPPGPLARLYGSVLGWSVRHHFIAVAIGLLVFAASFWSVQLLPAGFLPVPDTGRSLLVVELPPGSPLRATENVTEDIARRLRQRPEISSVFVHGGRVPPATNEVRKAQLTIIYAAEGERTLAQHDLELSIGRDLEQVPDIRFWFLDGDGLRDIAMVVTGPDSDTVSNVAAEFVAQMHRIPIISNVVSSATLDRPELRIRPRADLAARLGVSTESLSETIRVATIGDVEPTLAKFSDGDRQIPIRVQLDDSVRADRRMLEQLRVPLPGGRGSLPLGTLADISLEQGPGDITRYDRERQATVGADLVGNAVIGQALTEIDKLPLMKSLPPKVSIKPSGAAESTDKLFDGFASAVRNGLAMVYALLVLLFGSLVQPITVLLSLPLSMRGAILGLTVFGRPLSMPAVVGILLLAGIVIKHSIMLVDFARTAIRAGMPPDLATIDAGRKRARPIIMTTIILVAGLLPSAFAVRAGGEFVAPMAIAVIGGLIVSTLLSLIFAPALFLVMNDVTRVLTRRLAPVTPTSSDGDMTHAKPRAAR